MPVEPDLARRAHALLTRAMEVEPAQRRLFVRGQCEGEERLAVRVLELLDAADRSEKFLDQPALDSGFDQAFQIPDAVGDYLVVGVLGSGGMATVYEAIQDHPKRRVALKVMHQSVTHAEAYVRFRFETEALARLHHPGIAQIYEAGAAQLGQPSPSPFFAMELVPDAVPITEYADQHGLPLRARLVMLASVCDAVHHGHQHGIIHRDLKPANVLVDGEGHAKVIDFGVARTTDAGESLTAALGVPQLVGTLHYMSPEQCGARREIDIRTDVYSLGVLLYQLVCRTLPYDLRGLPLPAALQAITQQPPCRPQIRHARARDLEAVILKAIEKDPDRRYDSASALAADLRHFLAHQAIQARPPALLDQFRLFAWRNRVLVTIGLTALIGVFLVAAVSTGFAVRLSHEVDRRRTAEQGVMKERDLALWQAYTAQIAGALSAKNTGEFQQMRTRLAAATHQPRGWEWGFLSRMAESSVGTIAASDNMIMDMAVSRDWQRMATAAADGTIRVWDRTTGTPIAEFRSPSRVRAMSIGFSSDERYVVSGDLEGVVRLHDAGDLHLVRILAELRGNVRSVIGLPDGRIAAANGRAVLASVETGEITPLADDQPEGVHGLALSEDGELLATFNEHGDVWVRRAADFSVVYRLEFEGSVNQVRFSRDGRIGAAGAGGQLVIWSLADGTVQHRLKATPGVNTVRSLAFSNDGRIIAAGLVHRGILLASSADGRILGELGGHTEAVSALSFRPDDQVFMSSSWDGTIRTWRTDEVGSPSGTVTLKGHDNHVMELAFSPDGSVIASASRDGSLRLWDPDVGEPLARFGGGGELSAVAFSPDGRLIASAGSGRTVTIRSADTGAVVEELTGDGGGFATLAFNGAGRRLAAGGQNGTIQVWSLGAPEPELVLRGHDARVNSVMFSPDGTLIASGSRDRGVRLWDSRSGAGLAGWTDHQLDVFAVVFSGDGRRLYSGSRDQTIRVWDVETRTLVATLAGHGQYVTCLALSPDETRLAAGSWFGEILLFDVPTLDLIASFRAHDSAIRGIAFSPDGRWIGSASYDATVRLFDSASRQDSDAARERALAARSAAQRLVCPLIDSVRGDQAAVLGRLKGAGLDWVTDPAVRKVILSELAPLESP